MFIGIIPGDFSGLIHLTWIFKYCMLDSTSDKNVRAEPKIAEQMVRE